MISRRSLTAGALVTLTYLGVAVATATVSGHSVLPLYEGVGNAPPYQWVNPPAAFKTGNVVPGPNTTLIALGANGNREGGIASKDTQFIVTLSNGAIPPKAPSKQASIRMEPLDPATLGALPGGARADGNAYRLSVAYDPNLGSLTTFAARASTVLSVPLPANRGLFYSADGQQWTRIAPPPPKSETTTVSGAFTSVGIFLAGTTHKASASSGASGTSVATVIIGVLVGVLLVGGGVWFLLRLMRPASARASSRARRPPPRRR